MKRVAGIVISGIVVWFALDGIEADFGQIVGLIVSGSLSVIGWSGLIAAHWFTRNKP